MIMVPPDRNPLRGFRSEGTKITGDFGPVLDNLVRAMKTDQIIGPRGPKSLGIVERKLPAWGSNRGLLFRPPTL